MGLLSSYVDSVWYTWGVIIGVALLLAFIGDMSMVISKIDGGNGLPWLVAHGVGILGNLLITVVTFVMTDLVTAFLFLVYSFGILILEGAVTMGVIQLTINFVTRNK